MSGNFRDGSFSLPLRLTCVQTDNPEPLARQAGRYGKGSLQIGMSNFRDIFARISVTCLTDILIVSLNANKMALSYHFPFAGHTFLQKVTISCWILRLVIPICVQMDNPEPEARQAGREGSGSFQFETTERKLVLQMPRAVAEAELWLLRIGVVLVALSLALGSFASTVGTTL